MTKSLRLRTVKHMIPNCALRRLSHLVVVAVVVAGCSSGTTAQVEPTVSIPPRSTPTTTAATATTSIEAAAGGMEDDEFSAAFAEIVTSVEGGAVAAVRVADGPLVIAGAGTEPDGTPVEADAVVRVGSISKLVTTVLVLGLVEDGAIDLDARLDTILPDTPVGGDATVRQLLSHRTGIPNYTDNAGFFAAVLRRPNRSVAPDEILGFADPDDAAFAPGERFAYSNTNYVLLGQIVESVSGRTLAEELDRQITGPLGLTMTAFDDGSRNDVIDAHTAFVPSGSTDFDYTSVATSAWAAGSLVTTAEELARFATALFDGELLDAALVDEMRAPLEAGAEYGLGLHPGPDFGVGHGGAIPGFNSILQLDPATGDLLIVVVGNDLRSPEALTEAVWEAAGGT